MGTLGTLMRRRLEDGLERLLRWRAFPGVFQWTLLVGLALNLVLALRVPRHAELNPGAALVWQLWWPLLPFFILLTARLWCAICPFPALGNAAQHLRPALPSPPRWLRRAGPWVAAIGLGLLGFFFLLLQVESSGPLTAALLLAFAMGAVATALLWLGRAWCRYLCPLGLMVGLYSRLGWLRLEAGGDRKRAAATARRCPVFTSALAQRRVHDCVLCADCLRGQAGDAIRVRLGRPSLAGRPLMLAEAVAVSLLLGLLLADALRMTPLYPRFMAWALPISGRSYAVAMALGIGGVMATVVAAQVFGAHWLGRGEGLWRAFSRLSLAWLPLALAAILDLSAQHLLAADAVFQNLGAEIRLLPSGHMPPADAYASVWPMRTFQWAVLALGAVTAVYMARCPVPGEKRRGWAAAGAAPFLPLVVLFGQPMSVSC